MTVFTNLQFVSISCISIKIWDHREVKSGFTICMRTISKCVRAWRVFMHSSKDYDKIAIKQNLLVGR